MEPLKKIISILGLECAYTCWLREFWSSGKAIALYSEISIWNIGRKIGCPPSWGSWVFSSIPPGECCQLGTIASKRRPGTPLCVFFPTDQLEIFLQKLVMYRCVLWIHSHASNQVSSFSRVNRLQAGGQRNRGWIPSGSKTLFCYPKRAAWQWEEVVWSRHRLFIF
jgi:hypothetical protein